MVKDGGWLPLWRLEMTPGLMAVWTVLGLALVVVSSLAMVALAGSRHPELGGADASLALAALLLAVPVTLVLHEAVHGLAFRAFGGRPRFGAMVRNGLPVFFVSCPGQRFARDPFLVVGLAPLVVLDLVGLALLTFSSGGAAVAFGAAMVVVNTSAAIGDLWMSAVLLQTPRWAHVEDIIAGMVALAPPARAEAAGHRRPPIGLDVPVPRWAAIWLAGVLASWPLIFLALVVASSRTGSELWLGPIELARPLRHGALASAIGVTLLAMIAGALAAMLPRIVEALRRARSS